MTLQQLFDVIGENPTFIIIFFIGLPIVAFVMTWITEEDAYKSPWQFIYSGLIYLACVPGIFATLLVAYNVFFQGNSLLEVNLFVYFLPIFAMIATLLILSRKLHINRIPGFDKISGLVFMITAASITIFILDKMRILVFFYGSIWYLIGLFVILLVIFKVGFKRLFAKS
jgi:hypothetical protein